MAKAVAGDMVDPYLDDEFGPQRLPFRFRTLQAPAIPGSRSADFASIGAVSSGSGKSPTCSGVVAGLREEAASPWGRRRATMMRFLLQLLGRCIELHAVVADPGNEFTRACAVVIPCFRAK